MAGTSAAGTNRDSSDSNGGPIRIEDTSIATPARSASC